MKHCATVLALLVAALSTPALAQSDISGVWGARLQEDQSFRYEGPGVGEFQGTPINAAGRARAQAWTSSLSSVPERQCIPFPADYGSDFTNARIWSDVDPVTEKVVAYHISIAWMNSVRTIWMDGRPHPSPDAFHTWEGFSTGKWEGDMLTVTTTHLKPSYLRRNGLVRSDLATLVEHFSRFDDILTWVLIVTDPVYLAEPFIKSQDLYFDPGLQTTLFPCSVDIEVQRAEGAVPHYLPGKNPDLYESADKHRLSKAAVEGGPETQYPEFKPKAASATPAGPPAAKGAAR